MSTALGRAANSGTITNGLEQSGTLARALITSWDKANYLKLLSGHRLKPALSETVSIVQNWRFRDVFSRDRRDYGREKNWPEENWIDCKL
jgi:hypothetical protein